VVFVFSYYHKKTLQFGMAGKLYFYREKTILLRWCLLKNDVYFAQLKKRNKPKPDFKGKNMS